MTNFTDGDYGIDFGERAYQSEVDEMTRRLSENRRKCNTVRALIYEDSSGERHTIQESCTPSEMGDIMEALEIDRHTIHAKGWYDPIMGKWVVSGTSPELQESIRTMEPPTQG